MSNIYASAKQWDGVARMSLLMKERKILKPPGKELEETMRAKGHVPETKSALVNLDEEEKADLLCGLSERLAIALGS